METDATQPGMSGPHPTMAELRDPSVPHIHDHLAGCDMCRSVVAAADDTDAPIPLELPKGLVSEDAFRWPGDPIARAGPCHGAFVNQMSFSCFPKILRHCT